MSERKCSQKLLKIVEASTLHGIPSALRAKNKIVKIFWILIFFLSFSYCFYSVVQIILKYFEYKVIVKLEIDSTRDQEFPAVTFCNLNPFDYSIEENLKNVSEFLNESFLYGKQLNSKSCALPKDRIKDVLDNSLPDLKGFSIDKMLVSCEYSRKSCNKNDFSPQNSLIFKNCYTFNNGKNSSGHKIPILRSKGPDMINGLAINLFIGAPEYHPCWEKKIGAIVVIHNQSSRPVYIEDGKLLQPGTETNLVLTKVTIKKISKPFSNCIKDVNNIDELNSIYYRKAFDFSGIYIQKWCIINCSMERAFQENQLKCKFFNFTSSFDEKNCIVNLDNIYYYKKICQSQCPVECDNSNFNIAQSLASFPSYSHGSYLLSNESFRAKFPYKNISLENIKDIILSFNVYFDSIGDINIEELPKSDFGTLLGNLGGQLGLFLGISFLTYAEIFEIIFELEAIFWEGINKRKNSAIL